MNFQCTLHKYVEKLWLFFQSWPQAFVAFSHSTTFEKFQNQVVRKHIRSHENVGRKVLIFGFRVHKVRLFLHNKFTLHSVGIS